MKKKIILLLLTLTLCSFNLAKVNAETINWKAIKLYSTEKKVYRKYTKTDGTVERSKGNIAYIYMGNNTIYCIEMGRNIGPDLGAGKATTKFINPLNKYFTKNLDKKVKVGKQTINIIDAIGLISKYGTDYYNARKNDGQTTKMNSYYLATQAMIWQYLSEAGVYGDSIKGDILIYYEEGTTEKVIDLTSYKNNIISKINTYYKKPSIQGNVIGQSTGEHSYQFTLTDSNKVLKNYKVTTNTEGVTCTQKDYTITCSYSTETGSAPTSVNLTFTKEATGTNDKVFKVGNDYQATLLSNKTPAVTYNKTVNIGTQKYRLAILKTDSDDENILLEGVTYQICSDENCNNIIGEAETTNEDGIATFNDLEENVDYYVKEIETIDGYILDSAPKKVKIDTTNTTNYIKEQLTYMVNYVNKKEQINGYIQINKTDKKNNKPLEGITFDIYDENDKIVETIKTDKDGKAKTKLLPKGIYYVKEKETLKDYVLSEEEQVITIDVNDKVYDISFVNEKSPQTGDINILLVITIAICTLICAIIIYIKKINLVKNNTI